MKALSFGLFLALVMPQVVLAQAFGEYGRSLGGATQRHGSNPFGGFQQNGQGKRTSPGVGDLGTRSLPQLLVAAKEAGLFPRQDDEAEKMAQLSPGETLVPLVQSTGGNDWYMVKTQQGLIGWVKASDVRPQINKNSK
jgi:hypothetical protein